MSQKQVENTRDKFQQEQDKFSQHKWDLIKNFKGGKETYCKARIAQLTQLQSCSAPATTSRLGLLKKAHSIAFYALPFPLPRKTQKKTKKVKTKN